MSQAGLIQCANETTAKSARITKEGKKITYVMNIIQQPERARACGSGAKSSADRRPVDPPPIVELRVYEGPNAETDVTFSYNANFFLFATLENARHVPPGRPAAPPTQPAFPVLTGTPVAGMAYLDRPTPAGYFIFPDLSVRHEGKYRLGFSLYEELKNQRDMDSEVSPKDAEIQNSAHVSHRLEVKSTPFTVFSAKKFPGLSESTALSRMVAEQGCRVRIRRDVRMRRRENKTQEFDEYEEGSGGYERARQTATPDAYSNPHGLGTPHIAAEGIDRPRSVSDASHASFATPRRPSMEHMKMEHMNQGYQQPQQPQQQYSSPITPQTPQGMYPPQPPQWHQQQQQPPTGYMQQPPQSYPPQQTFQHPTPPINGGHFNSFMPPQYPSYDQQTHHMRNNSVEFPAPPTGPPPVPAPMQHQYPSSSQPMQPYGNMDNSYHRASISQPPPQPPQHPGHMQQPMSSAPAYSPAQQPSMEVKHDSISPYAHQSPAMGHSQEQQGYYTPVSVAPPKFHHTTTATGATKRSYSASFDTQHMDQPLRQGARPPSPVESKFPYNVEEEEPSTPLDEGAMSYRRADGTERRRQVPMAF